MGNAGWSEDPLWALRAKSRLPYWPVLSSFLQVRDTLAVKRREFITLDVIFFGRATFCSRASRHEL